MGRPEAGQAMGATACYVTFTDDEGVERRCRKPEGHEPPHGGPPTRVRWESGAGMLDVLDLLRWKDDGGDGRD
jgi:hypothetical protein